MIDEEILKNVLVDFCRLPRVYRGELSDVCRRLTGVLVEAAVIRVAHALTNDYANLSSEALCACAKDTKQKPKRKKIVSLKLPEEIRRHLQQTVS